MYGDTAYLAGLRRDLLRFARLQLRDLAAAEDAVQEALAAAWSGANAFEGQSQHRTWVFGILRHKLIDVLRGRKRSINVSALETELSEAELLDQILFAENGHWASHAKPSAWVTPETDLQRRQFWRLFEACMERLPEQIGRVFMMREFLDFDVAEICEELELTANHCSVLIYRARMKLRTCLSEQGMGHEEAYAHV
ncbi:sigma-70 family RNA polymerase sigma factor [Trinickia fusca]|uniref:Sigma-70 family RNA polymerase sigma factor n=2 Tax=Trinickia fusca TaxID=2419777 RepID=A0A494XIF5_9BURK|nr:sigma-70 family RNA polymerase sigma factor [Trinickia fusca]RKP48386.1 sigma-70 family RNA polymerase sigma factor [Trinickia fusca]